MDKWVEVRTIQVPDDVNVKVDGLRVEVDKAGRKIAREFKNRDLALSMDGKVVKIFVPNSKRKVMASAGAVRAHIENLILGVNEDFVYKLKVHYEHFPMKIKVDGDKVEIDNFIGRKKKIYAKILPDVKVNVQGQEITITSVSKENAGQTAANIENATRQTKLCDRKFLDSVFISYKP